MRLWTWITAIVILLGFFALYIATPTSNYTFDAVNYARMIELARTAGPKPLFHPHHLLFNAAGSVAWGLAEKWSPGIDPLSTLQLMNAFAGAAGILVFFLVLVRLLRQTSPANARAPSSIAIAAITATAVGFTFGWWVASTDGRPYIPPLAAVFTAFYFAYRTARTGSVRTAAAFGACLGVAILLHQSHGLTLIVGIAAVLLAPVARGDRLRISAAGLATLVPIVGIPYLLVLRLRAAQTISEAVDWTILYAKLGVWWDFNILGNIDKEFYAFRHAFLADVPTNAGATSWTAAVASQGILIFASILVVFILIDRYAGSYLWRRRHIIRTETPAAVGAKGGAAGAAVGAPDALLTFNVLAFVWLVSYFAFFAVWTPGFFVFWIPVAAMWMMVLVVNTSMGADRSLVISVGVLATVCFAIANANLYVLPKMPEESNAAIEISQRVRNNTPSDSLIIVTGMGYLAIMEVYIPYFADRDLISLHQAMLRYDSGGMTWLADRITQRIKKGRRVYILGEVLDSPQAWRELNARYGLEKEDVLLVLKPFKHKIRFAVSDQPVYELRVRPRETTKLRVPIRRRNARPHKRMRMIDLRGKAVE